MDHCTVTTHVKCKPVGYQATIYKPTPTPATPLPDVQPGVIDHLAKAMRREGQSSLLMPIVTPTRNKQGRLNLLSGFVMARHSRPYVLYKHLYLNTNTK